MLLTQKTEAALLALLSGHPSFSDLTRVQDLHVELIRRDQVRSRLNTLSAQNKEPTR